HHPAPPRPQRPLTSADGRPFMRIAIRHTTRYRYDAGVAQFVQQLRLMPPSVAGQTVVDWRIEAPGIERGARYTDAFGNEVVLITPWTSEASVTITRSEE